MSALRPAGQLRMALVGAGGIAQAYVQLARETPEIAITHVVDVRPDVAHAVAESVGPACRPCSDHRELDTAAIDGALVCTPPAAHAEVAVHFLRAKVPVLCEKPLAPSSAVARTMIQEADRHRTLLMMAAKFRYVDDLVRARSMIASGTIGEPLWIQNSFSGRVDMRGRWHSDPAVSGGGVLMDNGTHSVDIVRFLVGPITAVLAFEGRRVQGLAVEDTASLVARTESSTTAAIDLSWSIDKGLESYCDIYGTEGTIRLGWAASSIRRAGNPSWMQFGSGYRKLDAMRAEVLDFAKAVTSAQPPRITLADAMASVEVIEAAYRSLDSGSWATVAVEPPALQRVVGA